jgi:hypothetical protein
MDADAPAQTVLDRLLKLGESGVPVLRATVVELARLEGAQEQVASAALANTLLRDPLMTLRILQFLYSHRTRSQTQDITTIAHAIMMLGLGRFFREFGALPAIEDRLAAAPDAVIDVYASASRARLASLFARDWATQRHDMDPEEVMVAALVHDVTDLLVVCEWPQQPPAFSTLGRAELRAALFARLGLPGLLNELTADADTQHPRILNVSLACALARCCADGWSDPCLEELLQRVQRLLHISEQGVWERVRRIALQAAREWRFYQVRPAAAYLPMQAPAVSGESRAAITPS